MRPAQPLTLLRPAQPLGPLRPCPAALLASLYHMLPFRHQLFSAVASVMLDAYLVVPRQLVLMEQLQLRALAQPACNRLHSWLFLPLPKFLSLQAQRLCSDPEAPRYLLIYVMVLLAAVVPLQVRRRQLPLRCSSPLVLPGCPAASSGAGWAGEWRLGALSCPALGYHHLQPPATTLSCALAPGVP